MYGHGHLPDSAMKQMFPMHYKIPLYAMSARSSGYLVTQHNFIDTAGPRGEGNAWSYTRYTRKKGLS